MVGVVGERRVRTELQEEMVAMVLHFLLDKYFNIQF
jgi:hypothetical protein